MTRESDDLLQKIDHCILSTDWTKLDSHARRARRHKYISQGRVSFVFVGLTPY